MFSRLFRSRWAALFWAGGVLWTAYDVAGAQSATSNAAVDATGEQANATDLAVLAQTSPD